jgi:hypothetical protein
MKSIVVLIDYFGRWPDWFCVFLESCRENPTIDWCIHTDCPVPDNAPRNVRFISLSFADYCRHVSDRLAVRFAPSDAYNICNLKPMFGKVHRSIINGYDYFGWSDIDVVYGDIRSIYDDHVLTHNVISSHQYICSGHFCLVKNDPLFIEAFRSFKQWPALVEACSFEWAQSLDEAMLTALFCPDKFQRQHFSASFGIEDPPAAYYSNNFFVEQWSTPFVPSPWINGKMAHPEVWWLDRGALRNIDDGDRTFLYLHLMNFKGKRWFNEALYSDAITWDSLDTCLRFAPSALGQLSPEGRCFRIDRQGIHLVPLSSSATDSMH